MDLISVLSKEKDMESVNEKFFVLKICGMGRIQPKDVNFRFDLVLVKNKKSKSKGSNTSSGRGRNIKSPF